MAAPTGSVASLKAAAGGALVREDVMNKIWEKNIKETPFTDMIGSSTHTNRYTEWTEDTLASANTLNSYVEGADAAGDDTRIGTRVGNHTQGSRKIVRVNHAVEEHDLIGRSKEIAYQLANRQLELMRDVEATCLSNQGSIADDADTVAGRAASFGSFIKNQQYLLANAVGAVGFNVSTKVVANVAVSNSATTNAVSQTVLLQAVQESYANNGNITVLMSTPEIIAKVNAFLVANTLAQKATLQGNVPSFGNDGKEMVAQGYVTVFMTSFGTALKLLPNRIQPKYGASDATSTLNRADVFLIDTQRVELSYLTPYRSYELAKTGPSTKMEIDVDWTLKVPLVDAHAVLRNCNVAAAMIA